MLATIVIVTTANRQRVFGVENIEDLKAVGEKLERFQQLFRRNTLIIGSGNQTEIFSPSSITRLELHYTDGHGVIPEIRGADVIVAIDPAASSQVEEAKDGEFTGRVEFFFNGGDVLVTRVSDAAPTHPSEQIAQLNQTFAQEVISYRPQAGGIGFLNPANMTRLLIHAPVEILPSDAWRATTL